MTTKQFYWLKEHQPIEVCWFKPYEDKTPKDFHYLCHNIDMEFRGEYIIFSGTYHTWNGRGFVEHHARYKFHYKNIRQIRYRRKHQGQQPGEVTVGNE